MLQAISNYINEVVRGKKIRVGGQDAQWRKVAEIKIGDKILAVPLQKLPTEVAEANDESQRDTLLENKTTSGAVFFDEIVSIKRLSPERVWDIEVEDTHNFVAGHFIDRPSADFDRNCKHVPTDVLKRDKLSKNKNKIGSGTFGGILAHNTYISGNVGIGTTAPSNKLDVNGVVAGTYFVDYSNNAYGIDPAGTSNFGGYSQKITGGALLAVDSGNVGIGTTAPGYKLDVSGDINFSGKFREDGVEILSGMIAPFASACPTGWTEYTAARGRYVVGTPLSGTIAGTAGTALTDLENRAVGQHNHAITDPGHSHTYSAVQWGEGGIANAVQYNTVTANTGTSTTGISINNAGSVAGTNAPYIQLTYCQKTAGADIAEWIPASENISQETIVSIDPNNNQKIVASRKPYDSTVIGIIATKPGWLIGDESPGSVQLALAGRVPTRVSLKNGEIKRGDPVTTSSIPGVGMKATKAGAIIGKAMEALNETSSLTSCTDPATGQEEKCGTILVFINISWYDPDVYLTSTGDLKIVKKQPVSAPHNAANSTWQVGNVASASAEIATNSAEFVYDGNLNENQILDPRFQILDKTGNIIERIGAFSEAAIANLRVGAIQSQTIVTNSLTSLSAQISQIITDKITVREKIISPIVETASLSAQIAQISQISTSEIKPADQDLVIDLSSPISPNLPNPPDNPNAGKLAKLIIKGLEGKTAVVIDAEGSATFSGSLTSLTSLTAPSLSVENATISGTLAANEASLSGKLIAKEIESENITSLSSNVNDIQKLLADIKNQPLPDPQYYQNLDQGSKIDDGSNSSSLPSSIYHLTSNSLTVSGSSNLYNVSVTGSLLTGSMMIENNSIISLASDLKLSALERISLFDGNVTIARDGTITTKGELIAQGGIRTNTIQPLNQNEDISVKLNSNENLDIENSMKIGKLKIENSLGHEVASVDASGSAYFRQLSLDKYLDATQSGAIIAAPDNFAKNGLFAPAIETATASAGIGIVPTNQQEVIIYNDNVRNNSLIYLTPTAQIAQTSLTVSQKVVGTKPYFKVAIDKPVTIPVQFNWLIIN